jgi:hypothetical protein
MRGDDEQSGHLFSYLSPEQRVPANHPLRAIRTLRDDVFKEGPGDVALQHPPPAVHRAFHGRWDVARSVGRPK